VEKNGLILSRNHFFTIPHFAALRTRFPIFHPVCKTWPTWLFSYSSLFGIMKTASCMLGSNFSPIGSNYFTWNLAKTLSITKVVISWPLTIFCIYTLSISISSVLFNFSISTCSNAKAKLSCTSKSSLANFYIANYFPSSIYYLYRFTVLSFSAL